MHKSMTTRSRAYTRTNDLHKNGHRIWEKIINNRFRSHGPVIPSGNSNKFKRVMASFKKNNNKRGGSTLKKLIGGFNKLFR